MVNSAKIKYLNTGIKEDIRAKERIKEIAKLSHVTKIVGLCDLHQDKQEAPTSLAVASKRFIYPELTSNVINCGMSLINTDIDEHNLNKEFYNKMYKQLLMKNKLDDYYLSKSEIIEILYKGVDYIIDKYDMPISVKENMENGGRIKCNKNNIYCSVPPWILNRQILKNDPFINFKGNHFIEFQKVAKVDDESIAKKWNLKKGQIMILVHGDYSFTKILNWHYFPRIKESEKAFLLRKMLFFSKIFFHLYFNLQNTNNTTLKETLAIYFDANRTFTSVDSLSMEGERYLQAVIFSMNYAYANRLLFMVYLEQCIKKAYANNFNLNLLWDVAHDSIQNEIYNDSKNWITRKGAAKIYENKPVIIAGSYNMNSFLGIGLGNGEDYLNSYDHGSSYLIKEMSQYNKEKSNTSLLFKLSREGQAVKVKHIESTPIKLLTDILQKNKLVRPIAWLEPIANYKY